MKTKYLIIEELENGNLKITITKEGREYLEANFHGRETFMLWLDLMEESENKGSYAAVNPEKIGALSESVVIVNYADYDEESNFVEHEDTKYWYYPDYALENELEVLTDESEIILTAGYE